MLILNYADMMLDICHKHFNKVLIYHLCYIKILFEMFFYCFSASFNTPV